LNEKSAFCKLLFNTLQKRLRTWVDALTAQISAQHYLCYAEKVLAGATVHAAQALGLSHKGKIEVGFDFFDCLTDTDISSLR
jgi:cytosine/adenosine deaminase-related metal-dependent hydrolase